MKVNTVIEGDCLDVMSQFPDNCIDTILTDPPYGLEFMGKNWDHGIPGIPYWREALRVAKPGATLLAFGGTRTHHRLMVAIEDAGWEIRDVIMWLYGQGYPKSHDVSKAIDKAAGAEREVVGYQVAQGNTREKGAAGHYANGLNNVTGTKEIVKDGWNITAPSTPLAAKFDGYGSALKPSYEPIIVAMKPLDGTYADNAERWGVSGLWIDGGRVATNGEKRERKNSAKRNNNVNFNGSKVVINKPKDWDKGRWPANIIHDGSPEVEAEFAKAGVSKSPNKPVKQGQHNNKHSYRIASDVDTYGNGYADKGTPSRFFYCAKSSPSERGDYNCHPTVKPLALLKYLARITRPPDGGIVLDMFAGSGTTALACIAEGRDYILIELNPKGENYIEIIKRRIAEYTGQEIAPKEIELSEKQIVKQLGLW